MKNFVLRIVASGRSMLVASLAVVAVSCATSVKPQKSIGTTNLSQPAATRQRAAETDASKPAKASFYTCGMHPQVRSLDPDGKCPICQMPLLPAESVRVVDPASGKTNTAASFPAISGYYSCTMHPTVLSKDPDGKCPFCEMPLLPVENPVFIRDK
jgi:Zn-finger protein